MKIGIIGAGNVGSALGKGWAKKEHEVCYGVRDKLSSKAEGLCRQGGKVSVGTLQEAASFGDIVVLATPWQNTKSIVQELQDLAGKVLVDCTNPIAKDFTGLEVGHTTSGGEQVAQWAPGALVVKCFNTTGFNIMENPYFASGTPTMFLCGNDKQAKEKVASLASDLGFDPEDAGPLTQARYLEATAWLWISMAMKFGAGREIAFRLLRRD